ARLRPRPCSPLGPASLPQRRAEADYTSRRTPRGRRRRSGVAFLVVLAKQGRPPVAAPLQQLLQNVRNFQRQRLVVWLDGHQPRAGWLEQLWTVVLRWVSGW
ncbi:hypothetical protein E2320_013215, partial [Naja naja]